MATKQSRPRRRQGQDCFVAIERLLAMTACGDMQCSITYGPLSKRAFVRSIEIIGEISKHLPWELKNQ